jgi:flagellar motor switch protein FliN/FliY
MSEDNKDQPAADTDDWGSALAEQAQSAAPAPRFRAAARRAPRAGASTVGRRACVPAAAGQCRF